MPGFLGENCKKKDKYVVKLFIYDFPNIYIHI